MSRVVVEDVMEEIVKDVLDDVNEIGYQGEHLSYRGSL